MKRNFELLMAIGMLQSIGIKNGNQLRPEDIDVSTKQTKPPNGCKEYWFNISGYFSNGGNDMRRDESVFYCHAINNKSAIKKFNNWKSKQPTNEPATTGIPS